ncbi:TIM barrel protein [Paracoccus onubensis]|uniref:hydroxypyruvate isomerase family protein n=1 Tax=Paracoccus onubensis TaxID=1675788 RepID=UPI0027322A85|nr:TIM barrel protein [Paracoccus onubensis]MDP0929588.1 TIM barrel protein [Paracoccus onubensis]
MPRFAANLTRLFTEMPMDERFDAAARAGFTGVEILFPYDIPADHLSRLALAAGLEIVLINTPPPNWSGGPRGFAAIPGQEQRFRDNFDRTLRFAQVLHARQIHIMSGAADGPEARATFTKNLAWAVKRAPHASLNIKVINRDYMPGYFLSDFDLAAEIIAEIGAPNLGLQFDTYHAQVLSGDALGLWRKHAGIIRHIQIAGFPGRHEPIDGAFNFTAFFAELDQSGYRGWVSGEYDPEHLTENGLGWLPRG